MKPPQLFRSLSYGEREYLLSFARTHEREIALHEKPGGLWEKDVDGNDWSNVTEHCILEAARVDALAWFLGLPDDVRQNLVSAAIVHDFNKKADIRMTEEDIAAGGSGRKGNLDAEEESERILRAAGLEETVVPIAGCVSGEPQDVYSTKEILDSKSISPKEIARLVMHYVDGYTRGSAWAQPAEKRNKKTLNDVDRRKEMNASNQSYMKMNQEGLVLNEGHPFFKGMTRFEAEATLCHLIEDRFFAIMRQRGVPLEDPLCIPEFIDVYIRDRASKK